MTIAPMPPRPQQQGSSRAAPPPSASTPNAVGAVAIDPVRLLRKYKWVFAASVVLGAVVGFASYQVLRRVAPSFESFALFQVDPVQTQAGVATATIDEREMERFMGTQVQTMMSQQVLQRVVERPDFAGGQIEWSRQFTRSDVVDTTKARMQLEKLVSARPIPNSQLIRLAVSAPRAEDAFNLVGMVREEYLRSISQVEIRENENQQRALEAQINNAEDQIRRLLSERDEFLRTEGIDSLDGRATQLQNKLRDLNEKRGMYRLTIDGLRAELRRFDRENQAPGGPAFDDALRQQVDQDPNLANLRQRISALETEIQTMDNKGMGPRHRERQALQALLESARSQLERDRQRALERAWFGRIQQTRNLIETYEAQITQLDQDIADVQRQANELVLIQSQVADRTQRIQALRESQNDWSKRLANLQALAQQAGERQRRDRFQRDLFLDRIRVAQSERVPESLAFPRLVVIGPLGVVMVVGLVGGLVVLREVLDQRVKGPADVAIIPRTRVVGMIPLSAEDPSRPTSVETAFRDHPAGAMAEQFRAIRSPLLRRMQQAGHRSLLVTSGMPDSGSTTVALNMAFAIAASDQKVLLIDANLRRPKVHKLLKLEDHPGLSDVLAGECPASKAVVSSGVENLDILPVGSSDRRIFERLGSEVMGQLLTEAADRYDIIIIDSAPLMVSGDGIALANRADASLLVVKALSEKRGMVARLKNDLQETRGEFLGVLVNGVRGSSGGYVRRNIRATHEYQSKEG